MPVPDFQVHPTVTDTRRDYHQEFPSGNDCRVGSIGSTFNQGSTHSQTNVNIHFHFAGGGAADLVAPPHSNSNSGAGSGSGGPGVGGSRKRGIHTAILDTMQVTEVHLDDSSASDGQKAFKRLRHIMTPDLDVIDLD